MADGTRITTKRSRPKLGQSAQARWMRRQQEKGNCRSCGAPRPPELKQLCRPCQDKVNTYMKRYRSSKKAALPTETEKETANVDQGNLPESPQDKPQPLSE